MPKFVLILSLMLLVTCDDGNFEIPSFEFETNINSCGSFVLYRTNTSATEALVLTLSDAVILQEETTTPIEVAIDASNTQYRIFDTAVGNDYFCATVPPVEPIVLRNWEAVAGATNSISIETAAVYDTNNDLTGYEHTINLKNLVLESNGETLTYENYFFGSFTTSL